MSYICPHCKTATNLRQSDVAQNFLQLAPVYGNISIISKTFIYRCANPKCYKFKINVSISSGNFRGYNGDTPLVNNEQMIISKTMHPYVDVPIELPDYIPEAIRQDFNEAYAIKDLSPKASATLSRRAIQGMIRDFWGISKNRLIDEIEAIKDKVDPLTWEAIDSIRRIGNVGAHMEKNINEIIAIDDNESTLLLELITTLIHDWYVIRHERSERMKKVKEIADLKLS
jgi:hypothetical protein